MIVPTTLRKSFPPELIHGCGKPMTLVLDYLLLALKKPAEQAELEKQLDDSGTGLVLVTSGKKGKEETGAPIDRINNTATRFWVRTRNKKEVSARHLTALRTKAWRTRLDWIGPVYKVQKPKGLRGYMCPLPTAFMIKLAWEDHYPDAEQRKTELSKQLARFRFKEVPDEWKYPFRYWYAEREPTTRKSLYDLYQAFRKKKEDKNWEYHRLVDRVNFDVMPMIIRQAGHTPVDPFYARYQWNLQQIDAEYGWGFARGKGAIIAIFDYGFDLKHPDLKSRFQKDLGINLGDNGGDGAGDYTNPHGTACAGVVGAEMDHLGVVGLAPECDIIPLAFLKGEPSEVVDGIEHAIDNGADVICISHESAAWDDDDTVNKAIEYAHSKGVLICAAAGNDGGGPVTYPAKHPRVMACGAVDTNNARAGFSNIGTELSVLAPGEGIATTAPQGSGDGGGDYFTRRRGTSYAVPHVAGLAALLISAFHHLKGKPDELRAIIEESAKELRGGSPYNTASGRGKGRNNESGFGLINVKSAFVLAEKRYGKLNPLP